MPWLNKRWISFFIFSAVAAFVLVSMVGWANTQEANKKQNHLDSFGTDNNIDIAPPNYATNWTDSNEVLVSLVTVNSFDPNGKTGPALAVQFQYIPIFNLTSEVDSRAPAFNIQIIADEQTFNFPQDKVLPIQSFSLDAGGNPNNYPFDSYQAYTIITAFIPSTNTDISLTVYVQSATQGFTYTTLFQPVSDDGSTVLIGFDIRRSATSRTFAAIVFLLMWFLSLSIFIAAMSVWFRGKNTELPLVAISTALLFALPNIRNSQPGVPSTVGTTEDMVGFLWNILLVSISAISLLIKWVLQNKRPPPMPTAVQTDPENVEKPFLSGQ